MCESVSPRTINQSDFMKHMSSSLLSLAVIAIALLAAEQAHGQGYGQSRGFRGGNSGFGRPAFGQSRPAFSPYLNLLRGGNSTLSNYYGLVRPEQQFRRIDSQLQSGFGELQYDVRDLQDPRYLYRGSTLQDSGHRAQFFSDPYGSEGSIIETLNTRVQLMETLEPHPSSRRPPTGHGVWFGNRGTYFLAPGGQSLGQSQSARR
jgi:hypothetical protein